MGSNVFSIWQNSVLVHVGYYIKIYTEVDYNSVSHSSSAGNLSTGCQHIFILVGPYLWFTDGTFLLYPHSTQNTAALRASLHL